jgi:hypothetical protein
MYVELIKIKEVPSHYHLKTVPFWRDPLSYSVQVGANYCLSASAHLFLICPSLGFTLSLCSGGG